ncbi:MAG: hypothetical protein A3E21_02275 [Sulfurimonas sp. RIFCSPHIGHO2_12_FULL_36_9]|nr:MAG: hypothetical protein A3E21_02275 [Sulfurimonas sp. RIFCSPHIGHO2_12_FULL_36_9]
MEREKVEIHSLGCICRRGWNEKKWRFIHWGVIFSRSHVLLGSVYHQSAFHLWRGWNEKNIKVEIHSLGCNFGV